MRGAASGCRGSNSCPSLRENPPLQPAGALLVLGDRKRGRRQDRDAFKDAEREQVPITGDDVVRGALDRGLEHAVIGLVADREDVRSGALTIAVASIRSASVSRSLIAVASLG